jgi:hypothetical protein
LKISQPSFLPLFVMLPTCCAGWYNF